MSSFPNTVELVEETNDSMPVPSAGISQDLPSPVNLTYFPGTYCRIPETNTLHFVFPLTDFLGCTEEGCNNGKFVSLKRSPALTSITRHLRNIHHIPTPEIVRWWGKCQVRVPPMISRHKCLQKHYYKINKKIIDSQNFQHKCLPRGLSFPTGAGLASHSRAHARSEQYESVGASSLKQELKRKNRVPDNLIEDPVSDEDGNKDRNLPANRSVSSRSHSPTPSVS